MASKANFDKAVQDLTESLVRATRKHKDEPEKVEAYIRNKVDLIYKAGQEVGNTSVLTEIFG